MGKDSPFLFPCHLHANEVEKLYILFQGCSYCLTLKRNIRELKSSWSIPTTWHHWPFVSGMVKIGRFSQVNTLYFSLPFFVIVYFVDVLFQYFSCLHEFHGSVERMNVNESTIHTKMQLNVNHYFSSLQREFQIPFHRYISVGVHCSWYLI